MNAPKPGDWQCAGCEMWSRADRNQCYECGRAMNEPTLTDTERRAFWQAMCEWNDIDDGFGRDVPSNAVLYAAVERIVVEAVDRERAAQNERIKAVLLGAFYIPSQYDEDPLIYAESLRGLLAADDTEGKP